MGEILKNLPKIDVFITDIDGTVKADRAKTWVDNRKVLRDKSPINMELVASIQELKSNGVLFGVASGWSRKGIGYYFQNEADMIIAEDGGLLEAKGILYTPDQIYGLDLNEKLRERERIKQRHEAIPWEITPFKGSAEVRLSYFHAPDNYEEFAKLCLRNVEEIDGWTVKTSSHRDFMLVDYIPSCFNKYQALRLYLKKTGTDPTRIAYFGDDYNDLEIFQAPEIGLKIAPKTANPKIQQLADWIVEQPPGGAIALIRGFANVIRSVHKK